MTMITTGAVLATRRCFPLMTLRQAGVVVRGASQLQGQRGGAAISSSGRMASSSLSTLTTGRGGFRDAGNNKVDTTMTTTIAAAENKNKYNFSTRVVRTNEEEGQQDTTTLLSNVAGGINGHHHSLPPAAAEWDDTTKKSKSNPTSTGVAGVGPRDPPRTSLLMELTDRVGILHDVLRWFWKYDINITRIESRPVKPSSSSSSAGDEESSKKKKKKFDFFIDFQGQPGIGDDNVDGLLKDLECEVEKLLVLDRKKVHWFPRHISELDLIAHRTLDAGKDLESDHPGFNDPVYRSRRSQLTQLALDHKWDEPIPYLDYTPEEIQTWTCVWDEMEPLWDKYACKEYKESLNEMKYHCGYKRTSIPQAQDISTYLQQKTNFRMRPVAGLLSSRDFLNGLAYRVFFSTQYIRHHSMPLYTPEPDICHELLGHAPMFANGDFADFSQEIGLASLGASDDDVQKLAYCYWHSVEFGLCKEEEDGENYKAYGAGLLSSYGELEYACGGGGGDNGTTPPSSDDTKKAKKKPEILPWDPKVASIQEFPITTYQPTYFLAESLHDAKTKMRQYCETLPRPFFATYNEQTESVYIDRPVRRAVGIPAIEEVVTEEEKEDGVVA